MNLPIGKQKGIIYLERDGFKLYLSKKNISAKLEFEKGTMENLEYVNQGKLDTQVARFVQKYQLEPASLVVVLSDSVIFSKKYTIKSLDKNTHAINDFLDELPFVPDQIVYKSFGLGYEPGKAIAVATNINVYIGLIGSFSRLGWNIKAIVPEAAIGVVGVSVASISKILKDKKMLAEADFLKATPDNILKKTTPEKKKKKEKKSKAQTKDTVTKDNKEVGAISSLAFDASPSDENNNQESVTQEETSSLSGLTSVHGMKTIPMKGNSKRSPAFIPAVIVISVLIVIMGTYAIVRSLKDNKSTSTDTGTSGPAISPAPDTPESQDKIDSEKTDELTMKNIGSDTTPALDDPNDSNNKNIVSDTNPKINVTYTEKSKLTIQVLNGTGTAGLAGTTKTAIEALGFSNVSVGNSDTPFIDDTIINYVATVSLDHLNEIKNGLSGDFSNILTLKIADTSDYDIVITTGKEK